MIRSIRLQHFKRYEDQTLDLRPNIIILVGPNSSGKSSLLKSMLAYKQTYEDRADHSGFLSDGDYVDIGQFVEYVRNHNIKGQCIFSFEMYIPRPLQLGYSMPRVRHATVSITQANDPQTGHGRTIKYQIQLNPKGNDAGPISALCPTDRCITYTRMEKSEESYKLQFSEALFDAMRTASTQSKRIPAPNLKYRYLLSKLQSGDLQAKRSNDRGMISEPIRHVEYSASFFVNLIERQLVNPFHLDLVSDLVERTFALAALRDIAKRSSPKTDETLRVGTRGENLASVYFNLRERALKAGKRQSHITDDFNRLVKWIERLRLSRNIAVSGWRDLIDLRAAVTDDASGTHSIVDMGVGLSQVLPILVQLAVMPNGSRLILEQPELHLYPWAQSEMGMLLCEEAKRTNKQLIIETHSEHIIRGVQRHVSNARTKGLTNYLEADDVAVYYVHPEGDVDRLDLDTTGEFITPWPSGFFDQGIHAIREIIENKSLPSVEE